MHLSPRAVIGIENNKLEAVASLRRASAGAGIKIAVLKTKYPQGSEKHLIKAVLNREVPLGGGAWGLATVPGPANLTPCMS